MITASANSPAAVSQHPLESVPGSFRDPSGRVVRIDGKFIRLIAPCYREHFEHLHGSGLYDALVKDGLLLRHAEVDGARFPAAYKAVEPEQLSFISYPYEWSFRQLKDAALATLAIQEKALEHGMILKDASAFNIQFVRGRPVLIDTLSFEKLRLNEPWVAYAQFCRHFLAPLALMSYRDVRLGQLLRIHIDGVPLDLASALLPRRTHLKPWLLIHLHWHARSQRKTSAVTRASLKPRYSMHSLKGTLQTLTSAVKQLRWEPPKTAWAAYYAESVTPGDYVAHKKQVVAGFLKEANPRSVWDLGANTGLFSRLATSCQIPTVAFDSDASCVEINYREAKRASDACLLPLFTDLVNPTPALGWDLQERMSFFERPKPDLVMALALVHHIAIGNNVPLDRIAAFFARIAPQLIIEFVPKDDPNARKLLQVRKDIFQEYTREHFERQFGVYFVIERAQAMANSERVLYLIRRRSGSVG